MRRTAGGKRKFPIGLELRVTPGMRRKVDDLARWLAAGDPRTLKVARETVIQLLREASGR